MSLPLVPIAAIAAFLLLTRSKPARTSAPLPEPPEPDPEPGQDGEGGPDGSAPPPPPEPKPKPGKDYVADVGLGSRGKGPGKPGGIVFGGDNVPPPPPPPDDPLPGHAVGHQIPAPLHFDRGIVSSDDAHEVTLSDQLGPHPLPSGRWRVRLVFVASVSAPRLVKHPSTYAWDYAKTAVYTQRETLDYEITVDQDAGSIVPKGKSTKWLDNKLQLFMFGCGTKEECGWNGSYTSFFHPRLVWNNGLELRFDTRRLAVDPDEAGILITNIVADVSFQEAP